jgi:hypothetical protein
MIFSFFCRIPSVHPALRAHPLAPDIALADSSLLVGTVYVFEVSLLLVEEGTASNS